MLEKAMLFAEDDSLLRLKQLTVSWTDTVNLPLQCSYIWKEAARLVWARTHIGGKACVLVFWYFNKEHFSPAPHGTISELVCFFRSTKSTKIRIWSKRPTGLYFLFPTSRLKCQ